MKSELSKKRFKTSHFGNMNYLGNTASSNRVRFFKIGQKNSIQVR